MQSRAYRRLPSWQSRGTTTEGGGRRAGRTSSGRKEGHEQAPQEGWQVSGRLVREGGRVTRRWYLLGIVKDGQGRGPRSKLANNV